MTISIGALLALFLLCCAIAYVMSYLQYRNDLRIANETAQMARNMAEELAHRRRIESGFVPLDPTTHQRA